VGKLPRPTWPQTPVPRPALALEEESLARDAADDWGLKGPRTGLRVRRLLPRAGDALEPNRG